MPIASSSRVSADTSPSHAAGSAVSEDNFASVARPCRSIGPTMPGPRGRKFEMRHRAALAHITGISAEFETIPHVFGEYDYSHRPEHLQSKSVAKLARDAKILVAERNRIQNFDPGHLAGSAREAEQRKQTLRADHDRMMQQLTTLRTRAAQLDLLSSGIPNHHRPYDERKEQYALHLVGPAKPIACVTMHADDFLLRTDMPLELFVSPESAAARGKAMLRDRDDLTYREFEMREPCTKHRREHVKINSYVYDKPALQRLLDANRAILERAAWPRKAEKFVRRVNDQEVPAFRLDLEDLYDLIRVAFADPRYRREYAIDPQRPTRNVQLPEGVDAVAKMPGYFHPPRTDPLPR